MNNIKKRKKILWFSPYAPYDKVAHAGGQDFNYMLKFFNKSQQFEIHVATLCWKHDLPFLDFKEHNIEHTIHIINKSKLIYHIGLMIDVIAENNAFHYCGNLLTPFTKYCFKKLIKTMKSKNLQPDIIILHWTQSSLLTPFIKKVYPNARIVSIEVDVAYLGYKRQYDNAIMPKTRTLWKSKYENLKKAELSVLKSVDLILCLNDKDAHLLTTDGIEARKIVITVPFFHNYSYVPRLAPTTNIIYFGYMGRDENHRGALWFINNVLPLLDPSFKFVVIGSEPKAELIQLQNDRVQVLGYIENIIPYFQNCYCLVAPLVLGAGIKIKILESLSFGIPVLTSSVGIEGIPAENGRDYFFCETPADYLSAIERLKSTELQNNIKHASRLLITKHFDTDVRLKELLKLLKEL